LQRRLASSPEAIYQSLLRRAAKLERHRQDIEAGRSTYDDLSDGAMSSAIDHLDDDEYSAAETEQLEEDLMDSATAARTVVELEAEIAELKVLAAAAKRVRDSAEDRKWVELRRILEDHTLLEADDGTPRKL